MNKASVETAVGVFLIIGLVFLMIGGGILLSQAYVSNKTFGNQFVLTALLFILLGIVILILGLIGAVYLMCTL